MKLSKTILTAVIAAAMTIAVAGPLRAATCNYTTIYNQIAGGNWVDGSGCNFFAKDFSNLTFVGGSRFTGTTTNLNLARFDYSYANSVNFREASMIGAYMYDAQLKDADFQDTNLHVANLAQTNAEGANFREANLERANLQGMFAWGSTTPPSSVDQISFYDATLRYTDLRSTFLNFANMVSADLTLARLDNGLFYKARIYFVTGDQMSATNAILRNAFLYSSSFQHADFTDADLRYSSMHSSDFRSSDFIDADLRYANMSNADFRNADFTGANIYGADLQGANLQGAKWTTGAICQNGSIGVCLTL